jgi:signal transduction histidine kinase
MNRLRKYFWVRSISFRLHLFIVMTIVLTVFAVSYLDSRVSIRMVDLEIQQNASGAASQIAEDLSRPDAPSDPENVRNWLRKSMESEPYIVRIDVYHFAGGTLTRFVTTSTSESQPIAVDETAAIRDSKTLLIPLYDDRERFVKVIVPFRDSAGTRGCISLIATLRQSDLVGKIHNRIAYFLIPGSILVSLFLLHFLFTRLLMRRFDRLIAAMNAARGGNLGVRATIEHNDELGIIAQRYNEMMEQIELASQERDRLLKEQKNFNVQLQERVQEATHELSSANLKLVRVNEDLIDTQRRLTKAERAAMVGQMAATFAHEIGSPLSAISTHLELMAEDPTISEDTQRRLKLIRDQVSRITGFVEELLSESRASMRERSNVQLNEILQQLLLFLEQHLERCKVTIETHLSPDLPEIEANPQQLQQVFLNLLNNACDAMPGGGKVVVGTSAVLDESGAHVLATVADTGMGIPEEKLGHIFEPFFSTKDLNRGTGLGLSIAAKIIRQHGGTIELHSVPGSGTEFTVRFPVPGRRSDVTLELAAKENS